MSNFNLTGEALRKSLICAVDVSEGIGTPKWEIQGYKVEEANIDLSPDVTEITDILGNTYSSIDGMKTAMDFGSNILRMGAKLNELMLKYWRNGELNRFAEFKAFIGYGFIGTEGAFEADMFEKCTVFPNSIGGSSRIDMPFRISFGGSKVQGTINKLTGDDIVFTA